MAQMRRNRESVTLSKPQIQGEWLTREEEYVVGEKTLVCLSDDGNGNTEQETLLNCQQNRKWLRLVANYQLRQRYDDDGDI